MSDELAVYRQCVADFRALVTRFPQLMVPANQARFASYMRKQMDTEVNSIRKQIDTQGDVMPPKDYRVMGEDLVNIAVRIPASVMGEIDAHVERLRASSRWARVARSDALRDLILRALDSLATSTPPAVSPQPEPTIAPGAEDNSEQIATIIATPENNYYEQIETVLPGDMPEASIRTQQAKPPASGAVYDQSKQHLGPLCKYGHDYNGTGQSLRNAKNDCLVCRAERNKQDRAKKRLGPGRHRGTDEEFTNEQA